MEANLRAFKAGYHFGETAELFESSYEVKPAVLEPGRVRQHHRQHRRRPGASSPPPSCSGLPLFLGTYPITPASDILHELSKHKQFGVRTFQAEDEISGIGAALGAAFGGALGVTTTSGPGIDLKSETMGLAISLELPAADHRHPARRPVDRPADQDRAGRPAPRHVRPPRRGARCRSSRPRRPSHCFDAALEAVRIAVKYRTPVILLSDGYLANGAEPWRLPDLDDLPDRSTRASPPSPTTPRPTAPRSSGPTSATTRRWPGPGRRPGVPGLEHRIGGLEKADGSGNVAYDGRQPRADDPPAGGQDRRHRRATSRRPRSTTRTGAEVLVIGWGSTYGAIAAGGRSGCGPGATRWPRPTWSTSTRSRPTSATCCAATSGCWSPRSTWAS